MDFRFLDDAALLRMARELARVEREATLSVLLCIAEVDRRGAYKEEAYSSLFDYCRRDLRYSENAAYRRIQSARLASLYPALYSFLRDRSLSLTSLCLLAPHMTQDNHLALAAAAAHKSRLDVERIVAAIAPKPESRDAIRVLSVYAPTQSPPAPSPAASIMASPELPASGREPERPREARLKFSFTASEAFLAAIEQLRALLWHKHPHGRLEDVLLEAREFIQRRDPARPRRPSGQKGLNPGSRKIPAEVARAVALRDGQRCAFISGSGRRCAETRSLELDHVRPWARGGRSDDVSNVRLLCRGHNQWAAIQAFGRKRCEPQPEPSS